MIDTTGILPLRVGPRIGIGRGDAIAPPGRDGPDSVLYPTCPEQWTLVASGVKQPDYLWTFQEASGNFVDVANNPGAVLVAHADTTYQQTVAGWTTKFFNTAVELSARGAQGAISTLWNIGNQSIFVLLYSAVTQSGGNRCMFLGGGANGLQIEIINTGRATCFCNSVRVTGSFTYEDVTPTAHPFALSYDRRGSGAVRVNTEKELITGTWANLSDNIKGIGSNSIAPPISRHCLLAVWVGLDAETMMDRGGAGLGGKQLIADLGWPMAY